MFILETNEVGNAMFAKGQKVELDIDLWHKRFVEIQAQHRPSRLKKPRTVG